MNLVLKCSFVSPRPHPQRSRPDRRIAPTSGISAGQCGAMIADVSARLRLNSLMNFAQESVVSKRSQ